MRKRKTGRHIHTGIIQHGEIVDEDGLYFVFRDVDTEKIIGVASLAASGIIFEQTNFMHVLPAVKIDVLAVDVDYQKMHYDRASEASDPPEDHYYFSDEIMGEIVRHCRALSETKALAEFIVLLCRCKASSLYKKWVL